MPSNRSTVRVSLCLLLCLATPAASIELHAFHPSELTVTGIREPSWSPNSDYLAYIGEWWPSPYSMSSSFVGAAKFDREFLAWLPLVFHGPDPLAGVSSPTWSPDGTRIAYIFYAAGGPTGIWTVGESSATALLLSRPGARFCAWSPSGDAIAFVAADSLWLTTADASSVRLLTTGVDSKPSWSPDGRSIVFAAGGLWVLDIVTGARRQLTTDQAEDSNPSWSPNGHWIAFASNRAGHYDLWVIPASGGQAFQLTDDEHWDDQPAWSPRGDRIAFWSSRVHPNPNLSMRGIWIASQLPDVVTETAPRSWSQLKRSYR
jgi:Tol biopolymer transport system component